MNICRSLSAVLVLLLVVSCTSKKEDQRTLEERKMNEMREKFEKEAAVSHERTMDFEAEISKKRREFDDRSSQKDNQEDEKFRAELQKCLDQAEAQVRGKRSKSGAPMEDRVARDKCHQTYQEKLNQMQRERQAERNAFQALMEKERMKFEEKLRKDRK